jgi:5-methylcytosine-specific restriction protein A
MPWDTSDRKARLPADWAKRRVRTLRRDGYRCQARDSLGIMCEAPANQVDHIIPSGSDEDDNLQSLCRWHHDRKSSAEGHAARRPRPRRARDPEPHPGTIH